MNNRIVENFAFAAEGSTADQILIAAGRLFAAKGFHGTSTREISAVVGIRQPSLFHHFGSKVEIAQYLFEYDRRRSPFLSGQKELHDAPPAVCVYQVLRREAQVILTSRYELQGLYLTEILLEDEFAFWRAAYDASVAWIEDRIRAGIENGAFIPQDPTLVVQLFDAMQTRMVRWSHNRATKVEPDNVATLLLRAILVEPNQLPDVRAEADLALAAQLTSEPASVV